MEPEPFLPENLSDWLTAIAVIGAAVATAAGATWKYLMHGRDARDKAMQDRMMELAQFEHNTSGRLGLLSDFMTRSQSDREALQRDIGKLEKEVEQQGADIRRIGEQFASQHGELLGQIGGVQKQLDMLIKLQRDRS